MIGKHWRPLLAVALFFASAPLAVDMARAIELPNLEDLKPLWNGTKWIDKDGNDITKLVEEAAHGGVPKAAPVTAPHYELPTAPLDTENVSPHDLPDVPANGPAADLPHYELPSAPLDPENVSPHDLPDPPKDLPGTAGYDNAGLPPPDYTAPGEPGYTAPEAPRYTDAPAYSSDPAGANATHIYDKVPPEVPVANVADPAKAPSFFMRNKKAIIKGAVMLGTMTVLMGTSVTVSQLSTAGIIH